ncbi:MAG TPA: protein kinase, partial [Pirellulales bacterium]|nr:protein kinase [Pirellulales bacterium]
MSLSHAKFIDALSQVGLLSPADIETLKAASVDKLDVDADPLARELVEQGRLSRYQAAALYQGQAEALMLGNYLVIDKLGAGGMGQVFRAQHRRMDRVVALKVLSKKQVGSPDAVTRFQREVKAAARLVHPHIVTAYDADEAAGSHYLVMEYVEGQDLSAVVKAQGPLKVPQAIDFMIQAARGLEHAHSQGIIHRDVKPSNLLLDKHGMVKILDMGLARVDNPLAGLDSGEGLTAAGRVMGTIDFMSPEQAQDTARADARSDIYSLGCTLYYLLTGKKPYESDTAMKTILAHREQPIPSLAKARPEVSPDLDAVYYKLVAKRPENRYATMREAREALEAVQAGRRPLGGARPASPVPLGPPLGVRLAEQPKGQPRPHRRKTKAARSKAPLTAAAVAVVLLIGVGGLIAVAIFSESPIKPVVVADATAEAATVSDASLPAMRAPPQTEPTGPASMTSPSLEGHAASGSPTGEQPAPPDTELLAAQAVDEDRAPDGPVVTAPASQAANPESVDVSAPASEFPDVPPDPALERKAAEWVLRRGGRLEIVYGGRLVALVPGDPLPRQSFTVSDVGLAKLKDITDDSLSNLDGLSHLTRLDLSQCKLSNGAVSHIVQHPWLISLLLSNNTKIDDAAFAELAVLGRLQRLRARSTQFGDLAAQSLAQIKTLFNVQIDHTRITDKGVGYLSQLPLEYLNIGTTEITDAALKHLERCEKLSYLGTNFNRITDEGLKSIERLPALRKLQLSQSTITAAGVDTLAGMKLLTLLAITDPPVSQSAYQKLRQALPSCRIAWAPATGNAASLAASAKASAPITRVAPAKPAAPATPAELTTSNRSAVPASAEQQRALSLVNTVFRSDLSQAKKPEDKGPLAEKLLAKAQEPQDDPAAVYALLDLARGFAADAADAELMAKITTELGSRFEVETLELLADDLEKSAQKAHPAAAFNAVAVTALAMVDDALAADKHGLAKRFSDTALLAARKAKDQALIKSAAERN